MPEICLKHKHDEVFEVIDCATGAAAELPSTPAPALAPARRTRAPSAYNLFIGACVKKKTGVITERFKECAREYKKKGG